MTHDAPANCPICGSPRIYLDPPVSELSELSVREMDVVNALRSGLRLREIARALEISVHTVRNHLKHANRKLGVHSQVELIAMLNGQLPPRRKRRA